MVQDAVMEDQASETRGAAYGLKVLLALPPFSSVPIVAGGREGRREEHLTYPFPRLLSLSLSLYNFRLSNQSDLPISPFDPFFSQVCCSTTLSIVVQKKHV